MQCLSYSAGHQGFLITLGILGLTSIWVTRGTKHRTILLGQIAILLVLSFTTKTFLKQWTESPRPYTDVFVEETIIDAQADFYALTTDEKNEVISMVTDTVSEWRTKHWLERPIIPSPLGTRSLLLFAYFSLPVYSQAINTNCSLHLFVFGR